MTKRHQETIESAYRDAETLEALQDIHAQYMGKKWEITLAMKSLWSLSPEEKKTQGSLLWSLKKALSAVYKEREAFFVKQAYDTTLARDSVDRSVSDSLRMGHYSLLMHMRRHVEDVCLRLGMDIQYGHEVVTKYENFESINIPLTHPATEMHDTIYLDHTDEFGESLVMRTHTSAHQVQYLREHGEGTRMCVLGRVYRNEKMDATHDTMFWQIEGLVVDKGISFAHLKGFMQEFLSLLLEKDVETRLRPAYFPFVEPGVEIDARIKGDDKWMELLGAGMVHPHVIKAWGLDPDEVSGFAFGIGMTRLAALKYNIKDIRRMTNGDLRFGQSLLLW